MVRVKPKEMTSSSAVQSEPASFGLSCPRDGDGCDATFVLARVEMEDKRWAGAICSGRVASVARIFCSCRYTFFEKFISRKVLLRFILTC